jgi:hypothetical protein
MNSTGPATNRPYELCSPKPFLERPGDSCLSLRTLTRSSARTKFAEPFCWPPRPAATPATPDIHDKMNGGVDHDIESVLIERYVA